MFISDAASSYGSGGWEVNIERERERERERDRERMHLLDYLK